MLGKCWNDQPWMVGGSPRCALLFWPQRSSNAAGASAALPGKPLRAAASKALAAELARCEGNAAIADLQAADEHGRTPLTLACILGRDDCVSALLAAGADVDFTQSPVRMQPFLVESGLAPLAQSASTLGTRTYTHFCQTIQPAVYRPRDVQ